MKHTASPRRPGTLELVKTSQQAVNTVQNPTSRGFCSEQNSVFDPHRIAKEQPHRWAQYCRDHFGENPVTIAEFFDVSEKTGRNWLGAKGGVNARHMTLALRSHPDTAPEILLGRGFAIAAE